MAIYRYKFFIFVAMYSVKYIYEKVKTFHSDAVVGIFRGDPNGKAIIFENAFENIDSKNELTEGHFSDVSVVYTGTNMLELYDFYENLVLALKNGEKSTKIEDRLFYENDKAELFAVEIMLRVRYLKPISSELPFDAYTDRVETDGGVMYSTRNCTEGAINKLIEL
jgi:hypothetical protein